MSSVRSHYVQMPVDVVQFAMFNAIDVHDIFGHGDFRSVENARFVHVVPGK